MKTYHDLLWEIIQNGESHQDRTGVGTLSLFGKQWSHDMRDGFPLLTTKKLPFRWIAEELFWFLSGSTQEQDLRAQGVDIWKEWATAEECQKFGRVEGDLGPVYGALWRSFPVGSLGRAEEEIPACDQIAGLMRDLVEQPNSRRLIVTGWHPYYQRQVTLPSCHTLFQLKVHPRPSPHPEELSLHLYAGSIDAFLGLPFNIASYGLLLSLLADATGRAPRRLVISFGDVHLYNTHINAARIQLSRPPRELPILQLDLPGPGGLESLLACRYGHLNMENYNPHPAIHAEVAV